MATALALHRSPRLGIAAIFIAATATFTLAAGGVVSIPTAPVRAVVVQTVNEDLGLR